MAHGFVEKYYASSHISSIRFTAGAVSTSLSAITFSNSNNVSFGLDNGTITATVRTDWDSRNTTAYLTTAMQSNANAISSINISAGTTSNNLTAVTLSDVNNISFLLNASTVSASVTTTYASQWEVCKPNMSYVTNAALGQNTIYIAPIDMHAHMSASRINFFFSFTVTNQGTGGATAGWTFSYGLYTKDAGNTTRLSLHKSASCYINVANGGGNTQFRATHPNGLSDANDVSTSQYAVTNATASNYPINSIAGFRVIPMPLSSTLTPGRYWIAVAQSTSSVNSNASIRATFIHYSVAGLYAFRPSAAASAATNASFFGMYQGAGIYNTVSGAFPATIALTTNDIRNTTALTVPYFNISGIATSTNWL